MHKQSGNIQLAVERLHALLAVYQADVAAWNELSEIHLANGNYTQAAHCYEELVMLKPTSSHYHNRLADAYYSIGDKEHILLARKHYTLSLDQQSHEINFHALYGLQASARWLSELSSNGQAVSAGDNDWKSKSKSDAADDEVNVALLRYATDKLNEMKLPTGENSQ